MTTLMTAAKETNRPPDGEERRRQRVRKRLKTSSVFSLVLVLRRYFKHS